MKVEEIVKQNTPDKLYLTKHALEKAKLLARIVSIIRKDDIECFFYLLREKDNKEDVVTELYFPENPILHVASAKLKAIEVFKAYEAADELGYEVIGIGHSHGAIGAYHSSTDKNRIKQLIDIIGPNTLKDVEDSDLSVAYVYSLVVNLRGETYSAMRKKAYCGCCGSKFLFREKKVKLGVVDSPVEINYRELFSEVWNKMHSQKLIEVGG